jgi:hypothetical protein
MMVTKKPTATKNPPTKKKKKKRPSHYRRRFRIVRTPEELRMYAITELAERLFWERQYNAKRAFDEATSFFDERVTRFPSSANDY